MHTRVHTDIDSVVNTNADTDTYRSHTRALDTEGERAGGERVRARKRHFHARAGLF